MTTRPTGNCFMCAGRGHQSDKSVPCTFCGGTGEQQVTLTQGAAVTVEALQEDGTTVTLNGKLRRDWKNGQDMQFEGGYVPADRLVKIEAQP